MGKKLLRILYVEDNLADVVFIEEMLNEEKAFGFNYTLENVELFAEALQRLDQNDIDLVLLDLSLPDSQGMDTFRAIKHKTPAMPVIVMTGMTDTKLAASAVLEGARDYLIKGKTDAAMLIRAIAKCCLEGKGQEFL